MARAGRLEAVAEVQGLYGPFTFSERLFQRIWLQGDFDRGAANTSAGRRVRVIHPGRWNRLGGPDFRDTRVQFEDGDERVGTSNCICMLPTGSSMATLTTGPMTE